MIIFIVLFKEYIYFLNKYVFFLTYLFDKYIFLIEVC
jgi:hypothetical protein